MTTEQIDRKRQEITARLATETNVDKVNELVEKLWNLARRSGANDLIIDLYDGKDVTDEGVEFAIESYETSDPRK